MSNHETEYLEAERYVDDEGRERVRGFAITSIKRPRFDTGSFLSTVGVNATVDEDDKIRTDEEQVIGRVVKRTGDTATVVVNIR